MNPVTHLKTAIQEYRALVVEDISGGEGTESWEEKLVIRFDYKKPEQPFFQVFEGKRDSKYSNQQINGENAPYSAGSKLEKVSKEDARIWLEDQNLSNDRFDRALEAHRTIIELRSMEL